MLVLRRDCRSAASTPKRGAPVPAKEDALRDECMGESSSEGDSHSTRSSGAGSKKRKRHACPSSGDARADAWWGSLLHTCMQVSLHTPSQGNAHLSPARAGLSLVGVLAAALRVLCLHSQFLCFFLVLPCDWC